MRASRNPSVFDAPNQWIDPVDPRHVGRIERCDGRIATVRWETGMLSEVPLGTLERVSGTTWVPGLGHVTA